MNQTKPEWCYYDAARGTLKISDDDIENARPFPEWTPNYAEWPRHLCVGPLRCEHLDKNAYHVLYLATEMRRTGKWIGPPCTVNDEGYVTDGGHRFRATQYLKSKFGIDIEVPVNERN